MILLYRVDSSIGRRLKTFSFSDLFYIQIWGLVRIEIERRRIFLTINCNVVINYGDMIQSFFFKLKSLDDSLINFNKIAIWSLYGKIFQEEFGSPPAKLAGLLSYTPG
jgi:hypothetical protein